jgi:transposase
MCQARQSILVCIAKGMTNSELSKETGHSRNLIKLVRHQITSGKNAFELHRKLGRPRKGCGEVSQRICELTLAHPRMSNKNLAYALSTGNEKYSEEWVRQNRHAFKFHFLPPIVTFPLTEIQMRNRFEFASRHLQAQTDWSKMIFIDQTSMWENNDNK